MVCCASVALYLYGASISRNARDLSEENDVKPLFALFAVTTVLLTACPAATPPTTTPPAATAVASILLSCSPTSIAVGATSACTATGKDSSGANLATQPNFTFTSSDTVKATVSSSGVVTGVATGSSSITAVSDAVTSNAVGISVTAPAPTLAAISLSCTPSYFAELHTNQHCCRRNQHLYSRW